MTEQQPITCYIHPNRETALRCNRCEQPICVDCAVKTPTGYRCKQCVKSQQKVFVTVKWYDYPVAIIVSGILSSLGSFVMIIAGNFFFILPFIIGPTIGFGIAEAVRFLVKRRRSEWLFRVTALAGGLAILPHVISNIVTIIGINAAQSQGLVEPGTAIYSYTPLIYIGIYLFTVVPAIYYRMKGIRLK